jgi:hypothetical protein
MADFLRIDNVEFSYVPIGNTGKYFAPMNFRDGVYDAFLTLTFTPINYVLSLDDDIDIVTFRLYIDNKSVCGYDNTGWFLQFDVEYDTIPPVNKPYTVSMNLNSVSNWEYIFTPGRHNVSMDMSIIAKPTYSGAYADGTGSTTLEYNSDNIFEIDSLNKIIGYVEIDGELQSYAGVARIYNNGEWKFCKIKNVD